MLKEKRAARRRVGRSFKDKLIDAMRVEMLLSVEPNIADAEAEWLFIKYLAKRAFDPKDPNADKLLGELLSRAYAPLKPTMQTVDFEFNENATPTEQVNQIMGAASRGELPPDVAVAFANAIKAAVDVEAITELKQRLEKLEIGLNGLEGYG